MIPTLPTTTRARAASILALAACAGAVHGAGIADVAPRASYLVVEIRDWPGLRVDLEASGALSLWNDEAVREYVRGIMGAFAGGEGFAAIEEDLAELGIDLESLPPLGSSTGLALFSAVKQGVDGRAIDDAEPEQQALLIATLDGDEADDGRTLWEIVDEAIERAEDQDEIEVEAVDYGEGDIYRIISRAEVQEWDERAWENWDPNAPDAEANFPEPRTIEVVNVDYVARAEGHLIYTTSFDALRDTIDRLEGRDRGETIADVRAFSDARAAGPLESHVAVVALPAAFVGEGLDMEDFPMPFPMGDAGMARGLFDTLGLTEVSAITAFSVTDSPDSVAEVLLAAHMDESRGVFSLITGDPLPAAPPSFVGPDAVSLGVFRVNFQEIIPLARRVFASLPDDPMLEGAQLQFDQFAAQVEPLFNALGPEVIQVGTLKRPLNERSPGAVTAITAKNADAVRDAINALGGMAGLLPRDFAGSQIWESQFFPLAIGLGSGYVFIGETEPVESAMLAASQPGAPKLADDPRFVPVERALGVGGIAMGWQDTRASLEMAAWSAENFERVLRANAESFGMPAEQVDEYVEFMLQQTPEAARTAPPVDAFTRVLGDIVSVFRVSERGIEGRVRLLRADR